MQLQLMDKTMKFSLQLIGVPFNLSADCIGLCETDLILPEYDYESRILFAIYNIHIVKLVL